jgi:hypothetical protein
MEVIMAFIPLELEEKISEDPFKILIFTEGTIIGPAKLRDWFNFQNYLPIKNSVEKIKTWADQGAEIYYLTSRKKAKEIDHIKRILIHYGFVGKKLYYRAKNEKYKDIAEELLPNIIIEDDCRSIGGKWQMTITYVQKEIKSKIKSIIVKEFDGIEQLPNNLKELSE